MLAWTLLHAALAATGAWLARRYALRRNLVDQPGDRRSHAVATPRGGGAGLVLALLVAITALAIRDPSQRVPLAALALALTMVAAVGWVDDHRPLSPWLRLSVQALAALVFAAGVQVASGSTVLGLLAWAATLVLANVWNFMDGIDGIAASQALLLGVAVALVAPGSWGWLGIALAAACAGFLPFNFPRARIFMGDVGSGTLGFAIGALLVVAAGRRPAVAPVLLLPVSAFLVDAGFTLARRMLRRERWWLPHTQHAYQVWARRSGHVFVTSIYVGWTTLGLVAMYALAAAPPRVAWPVVATWYALAGLAWFGLQRIGRSSAPTEGKRYG